MIEFAFDFFGYNLKKFTYKFLKPILTFSWNKKAFLFLKNLEGDTCE